MQCRHYSMYECVFLLLFKNIECGTCVVDSLLARGNNVKHKNHSSILGISKL
jgi:hypothetical protein